MGCGCHRPTEKLDFAGGEHLKGPWGEATSANLTSDPSGIGYYDEASFVKMIRTGYVGARELNSIMPFGEFQNLSDEDLKAIFSYLRTVPPIHHRVDNTLPPTYCKLCKGSTAPEIKINRKPRAAGTIIGVMRPLLTMAACVIALGLAPVWAQHGGGHASAGGHAFGGGHPSGGGHASFGGHSGGGGHAFSGSHPGTGSVAHPPFHNSPNRSSLNRSLSSRNFNHFRGPHRGIRIRTRDFRNNCWWFGCAWGFPFPDLGGGMDPNGWWNSGSSDDQDQQYGSSNDLNAQNQNNGQSTDDPGDQDLYARSAPPPPRERESTETVPGTVLVFRDQHKQEVQNYAIVGQTLWNFAPQHTQKIPLSDLDLPATTKANDERGVDFRLPSAREGQ